MNDIVLDGCEPCNTLMPIPTPTRCRDAVCAPRLALSVPLQKIHIRQLVKLNPTKDLPLSL